MTTSKRKSPKKQATKAKPKVRDAGEGGSVLERLVNLIGNVGIVVTAATKWTNIGLSGDSLDMFCRVQVSDEFDKPFEGSDAGSKVGDLVASINLALGK
jgi:hypothetical protein